MAIPLPTIRGVCPHDCPDTCGWVVTTDPTTGQAISLRGDKDHPFTKGFLCVKVSNYLERVYHKDRLLYPMQRVGKKGEGKFERITWERAIEIIVEKFQNIAQSQDGPEAILPYSYAGTMGKLQYGSLDRRFFHRLGASLLDRTICATAGAVGCDITLGTRAVVDPEAVVNARYIINWGSNTKVTNMHLWTIMHQARKVGAKIVTIDPYRSPTAQASDWWIPIRPGTDAALALGIMNRLYTWNLIDEEYLDQYCLGSEQLKQRALNEYSPEKVSHITTLPVDTIEQLAKEYGSSQRERNGPGFIRMNYGMQRHGGGAMAIRTVACLPALTGDWRYPGGGAMLSTSKTYPFDDMYLTRPDLIPAGTRTINMTQLAEALNNELPGPPVRALYVYNSNPAAICPDQSKVLKGLRREDMFTVVHEQFQTDTADYADILLPATTQLEHFDIHNSYGHLYVQVNQPAIAPLGEAKPNTEVFRLLANAMDFEPELFQISDEELAAESIPQDSERFRGINIDSLRRDGPKRLNLPRDWAPFANGQFETSTGKCHLYSPSELAMGRDPLPYYIPPHEDPQTRPDLAQYFPLQLLSPPSSTFLNSTFANIAILQKAAGEPTVEISESDAKLRNVTQNQYVRVYNNRGAFRAKAIITNNIKPGTIITFGIWWNKYTQDGVNANNTTSTALTDQGGGATFFDNLVQVEPVL